ncbi:hypothetical protein NP233_g296 [Leucocoprinus birnbaumii]|uniref:PHD-type domain-containing protein n=1 Tax=Leucocoprinus birnbaumii TaxID=56174 RepID=A0AAD5Z0E9_9AGAR|nr:hypothetical protein NP233_g296 [Leucocoprinus birnbaumii]
MLELQQRRERERLRNEEMLLERRKQERMLEQQRLHEEEQQRRFEEQRRIEEFRRREDEMEMRRRTEKFNEERRLEQERRNREREEDERRAEQEYKEHLRQQEEQHFYRKQEERRLHEEQLARREYEERLREEQKVEERKKQQHEERLLEEQRADELRRREEARRLSELRQQEEQRKEEQLRQRQQEERERLHREAQERELLRRQQEARMLNERPRSAQESPTQPHTPHSAPATIELPQPVRSFPAISGPRKSDPIPIKRPATLDNSTPHLSSSAPSSSADGERPAKKQRYSESPPSSATEPYPRVVALPPPIPTEMLYPVTAKGKKTMPPGDVPESKNRFPRVTVPTGRRSPPGSQIGRITAAKKSDEARRADEAAAAAAIADVRKESKPQSKEAPNGQRPSSSPTRSEPKSQERGPPVIAIAQDSPITKIEELIVRNSVDDSSRRMSLDVVMNDAQLDTAIVKKESPLSASFDAPSRSKEPQLKKEMVPRSLRDDQPKPTSRSSDPNRAVIDGQTLPPKTKETGATSQPQQPKQQQDPHEWLLDHYAQSPTIPRRSPPEPPRSPSPSISPVLAKTQPEAKSRTPLAVPSHPVISLRSVSPDADAALERELAELMAEDDEPAPVSKHEPDDMDIDLAVAETLEEEDKSKVAPMEVDAADDVEDELLSLVDDRPAAVPSSRKTATPTIPVTLPKGLSSLKAVVDDTKRLSPAPPSSVSPAVTSPVVRPPSVLGGSERGSMPPPSATPVPRGKDKDDEGSKKGEAVNATSAQAAKKKKDAGNKASFAFSRITVTKEKQSKAKAGGNKKAKTVDGAANSSSETKAPKQPKSSAAARKSGAASHVTTSRSRSTSVMPTGSVEPEVERKSEEKEEESEEAADDKLYCVCKTKYDEERVMIACDRCDEWYHMACVNMPENEAELIDQFFCPPCIEQNPQLNLKTTYKQRCLNGLRHSDPESTKACHRPARGAISKYCSDECGVEYMQSRIDAWAKKGGKKEELWESVKNSEKREGIAVCVDEKVKSDLDKKKKKQTKLDRETERLQGLLNQVVKMRDEIKGGMEILAWRERLLQLASERAEQIDQCGWDQRLCFGEEEWQDYGVGVLESYEGKDENEMQVEDEEWWCPGQKSCKRHNGWQTLRYKDICKEREKKEELLANLTTRERQLRKRIEDLVDPSGRKPNNSASQAPLKSSNTKLSNGHAKSRGATETLKKGKKRKAPAS